MYVVQGAVTAVMQWLKSNDNGGDVGACSLHFTTDKDTHNVDNKTVVSQPNATAHTPSGKPSSLCGYHRLAPTPNFSSVGPAQASPQVAWAPVVVRPLQD